MAIIRPKASKNSSGKTKRGKKPPLRTRRERSLQVKKTKRMKMTKRRARRMMKRLMARRKGPRKVHPRLTESRVSSLTPMVTQNPKDGAS